jgi:molybdenum cofactor biosynthesis protein B
VSVKEHHSHAPAPSAIRIAIVTVSDTRTTSTDDSGRLASELCRASGFTIIGEAILPDEPAKVAERVSKLASDGQVDAVLLTGGTGLSRRDTTVEAVRSLLHKTIEGYGELFRSLSYAAIGPAAMLSRAIAGTMGTVVVFTIPGSPDAVRLALEKLILPELPHVVAELHRHGPGVRSAQHAGTHRHGVSPGMLADSRQRSRTRQDVPRQARREAAAATRRDPPGSNRLARSAARA